MIHKGKSLFVIGLILVFFGVFYLVVSYETYRKKEIKASEDSLVSPTSSYEAIGCDSVTIAKAMGYDSVVAENKRITYNWNELRRRLARKEKYAEAPYRVIDTTKQ